MNLRERDAALTELMDDPACDPELLAATYRRFGVVNRLVSGWGTVWRTTLRPYLSGLGRPARVLDLGSGGGDLAERLVALARRDALAVSVTGADPDPRAHAAAITREGSGVQFVCTDSRALVEAGERYDVVVSNHVLHHLDSESFATFTDDSRALSRGVVLHSDIARSPVAYGLYAVGITPLAPGTLLRTDGLRSIRRSYRPEELERELGDGWRVSPAAPFRVLAEARGHA